MRGPRRRLLARQRSAELAAGEHPAMLRPVAAGPGVVMVWLFTASGALWTGRVVRVGE